MKEYTFEYTRQGFTYILFGISVGILVGCIVVFSVFHLLPVGVATILAFILPVVFFLLNKHRIKRTGVAKLSDKDLILILDETISISFSDLKYYYVYDGKNGVVFTLGFLDGSKLKMGANNNFCNVDQFNFFLKEFQLTIEKYKTENQTNIIHLESVFARRQTIYILSVLTFLVIGGFCFTTMPLMILPIGVSAGLLVGWIQYFQMRSQGKLVDF
jgi:hypothetical protein